ncbi:MAG: SDR family oxidoreductase [Pseudomonadota bacterium]
MHTATHRILITGATGVIGGAVARSLARPGVTAVLQCMSAEEKAAGLKKDVEEAGAAAHVVCADFASVEGSKEIVARAAKLMGGLDLLVHAAAVFERTPFGEVTGDQWEKIIAVDLRAAFFIAQEAGIAMQREGGRMIFLSDVAAVKPYAGYLPYCIAKAGIDALVRGLAKSLAPKVQVNAVAPYVVTRPSGMTDKGWDDLLSKTPMRRASKPEEVAAVVKMLAESGESITGQVISVDGGRLLR